MAIFDVFPPKKQKTMCHRIQNDIMNTNKIYKMKTLTTFFLFALVTQFSHAQKRISRNSVERKGQFYFYWGWNGSVFTNSDISFEGDDYDFTLSDVKATDHQTRFDPKTYFNPTKMTLPQYNFRMGYFFSDKYNISLGIDHMKYVVAQGQQVKITGTIQNSGTPYDGTYSDDAITIQPGFLEYEHTDGLNYINVGLRRMDVLYEYHRLRINHVEGLEAGILLPKTNATLLGNQRHDEFHLSGLGVDAILGLNFEFFDHFFIETEAKGGYIDLPDVRTTRFESDTAKQDFFFAQLNLVFGASFNILGGNNNK